MSIPSVNIRLDFGAGDASGNSEAQGPPPADLTALATSTSIGGGAPPPDVIPALVGINEEPPSPSSGGFEADGALSIAGDPPAPSSDIPGLGQGTADSLEMPPEPESEPDGSKAEKKSNRDK